MSMATEAETTADLDGLEPLLQAPARLQVMAVLSHVQDAEFARLREITKCSDSVLSKHLSALADADLIALRKAPVDGRQRTWARITATGRTRFGKHVAALKQILAGAAV
ncbi:DNA-binding transcriptional ArsR family regulator [Novosphingobium sp. BK486]|nr:DNA-binding transcriptional ArsR family regulator [Novosphingobium sp. BK256]MBB3373760.1 DNA-binding transcriptional ArsR family regulator [Novosphingobium sp. BK280]MBB3378172.1 DNA-binding transcriptional ArsR family regulator [Novosphingobium sp. BK258]MBB3420043.1 DNA-binding transcriptional ArsR family regulator [Novosphingobium sp. BK267]MBB3447635.1 DNA-binding transcriptional ArsR family regulator [Novosphingobium sp. BK352]MBB3500525.1 DNA-binding transcriptional ArsR family regul